MFCNILITVMMLDPHPLYKDVPGAQMVVSDYQGMGYDVDMKRTIFDRDAILSNILSIIVSVYSMCVLIFIMQYTGIYRAFIQYVYEYMYMQHHYFLDKDIFNGTFEYSQNFLEKEGRERYDLLIDYSGNSGETPNNHNKNGGGSSTSAKRRNNRRSKHLPTSVEIDLVVAEILREKVLKATLPTLKIKKMKFKTRRKVKYLHEEKGGLAGTKALKRDAKKYLNEVMPVLPHRPQELRKCRIANNVHMERRFTKWQRYTVFIIIVTSLVHNFIEGSQNNVGHVPPGKGYKSKWNQSPIIEMGMQHPQCEASSAQSLQEFQRRSSLEYVKPPKPRKICAKTCANAESGNEKCAKPPGRKGQQHPKARGERRKNKKQQPQRAIEAQQNQEFMDLVAVQASAITKMGAGCFQAPMLSSLLIKKTGKYNTTYTMHYLRYFNDHYTDITYDNNHTKVAQYKYQCESQYQYISKNVLIILHVLLRIPALA